jgi:hypothetical protein
MPAYIQEEMQTQQHMAMAAAGIGPGFAVFNSRHGVSERFQQTQPKGYGPRQKHEGCALQARVAVLGRVQTGG